MTEPQLGADVAMVNTAMVNAAINLTLAAVEQHRWQVVLLGKRSKKPTGAAWTITNDVDIVRRHAGAGGNLGLVCGPASRAGQLVPLSSQVIALLRVLKPLTGQELYLFPSNRRSKR